MAGMGLRLARIAGGGRAAYLGTQLFEGRERGEPVKFECAPRSAPASRGALTNLVAGPLLASWTLQLQLPLLPEKRFEEAVGFLVVGEAPLVSVPEQLAGYSERDCAQRQPLDVLRRG